MQKSEKLFLFPSGKVKTGESGRKKRFEKIAFEKFPVEEHCESGSNCLGEIF